MPILKRRSNYIKVYCPNGTRYASGKADTAEAAIIEAKVAFMREFGCIPDKEICKFEILGITGGWSATLSEIEDLRE